MGSPGSFTHAHTAGDEADTDAPLISTEDHMDLGKEQSPSVNMQPVANENISQVVQPSQTHHSPTSQPSPSPNPDIQMVEETILGGNDEASSAEVQVASDAREPSDQSPLNPADETGKALEQKEVQRASGNQEVIVSVATSATGLTNQPPTFNSIKERMGSLINDLGRSSLTRAEVNDVEDMMMDVKEVLYGAARRGRKAAL